MEMQPAYYSNARATWQRHRARGFSFTEILFAVMILGIGFIMVAAMFPVAIKQTAEAVEESTVATMSQEAGFIMGRLSNDANSTFPATNGAMVAVGTLPTVANYDGYTGGPSFYQLSGLNMRYSANPQYAWVPMYSRAAQSSTNGFLGKIAQVTLIGCGDRNTNAFADNAFPEASIAPPDLVVPTTSVIPPNLQGRQLLAVFTQVLGTGSPDQITFVGADSSSYDKTNASPSGFNSVCPYNTANGNASQAAAAMSAPAVGSYVVVVDDSALGNQDGSVYPVRHISCDGYIYRIGSSTTTPTLWNLAAGNDMKNARYAPVALPAITTSSLSGSSVTGPPGFKGAIRVIVLGAGVGNSTSSGSDLLLQGPAMDVCAFATFTKAQ